jgi:hypothetical protein
MSPHRSCQPSSLLLESILRSRFVFDPSPCRILSRRAAQRMPGKQERPSAAPCLLRNISPSPISPHCSFPPFHALRCRAVCRDGGSSHGPETLPPYVPLGRLRQWFDREDEQFMHCMAASSVTSRKNRPQNPCCISPPWSLFLCGDDQQKSWSKVGAGTQIFSCFEISAFNVDPHTFSAFWLRSSVVSVLISLISDTQSNGLLRLIQFLRGEIPRDVYIPGFSCVALVLHCHLGRTTGLFNQLMSSNRTKGTQACWRASASVCRKADTKAATSRPTLLRTLSHETSTKLWHPRTTFLCLGGYQHW